MNFTKDNSAKYQIDLELNNYCKQNLEFNELLKDALFPGRRTRSVLLLTLLKDKDEESISVAKCVEMAHRASIILDDMIDRDLLRRGKKCFHVVHGPSKTVLIANLLVFSAFLELTRNKFVANERIAYLFAKYGIHTINGELVDIGESNDFSVTTYYDKLLQKTSSLFELTTEIAALMNAYDESYINIYKSIGRELGKLYQMLNDYYDDINSLKGERGEKEVSVFNLTLLSAIAYSRSSINSKKILHDYFRKRTLTDRQYNSVYRLTHNNENLREAKKILLNQENLVRNYIKQLKTPWEEQIFRSIILRMKENKYHNHYELIEAGY